MTLSTNVAIQLPEDSAITPREVLDKAVEALYIVGGDDEWGPDHLPAVEKSRSWRGTNRIGTVVGQGFHAITEVEFDPTGPLYAQDATHRDLDPDDYSEEYADKVAYPACTYLLDMDTAYGYRSVSGLGAWGLHLAAIYQLREWVGSAGGSLKFQDESTGEWFDGMSDEGFMSVLDSGRQASNWFHNIVMPVIDAEVAAEGGEMRWAK